MSLRGGIDEALIAAAWERQAFDHSALAALGLQVVFRGMPSDAGGPDFQDAILAGRDGRVITGDVEFHVLASDWYRHGHARESRYNRVVLHVVWELDCDHTIRSDGVRVPTLVLSRAASLSPDSRPSGAGRPALARHACVQVFSRLTGAGLHDAVEALGWARFGARTDIFSAELETDQPDQVAYRALLEGLGHASNRQAFRQLAEAVPYGWVMALPAGDRASALLAGAGLASPGGIQPPARLAPAAWRLSRLRPGNHPVRRILAVTGLLERFTPSLAPSLVDHVAACGRPTQIRRLLVIRGPGDGAIGAGRADELAASAVLPLVAALEPDLEAPRTLLAGYPSPPGTRWTRAMLDLFEEAGHSFAVKRALHHQGLHLLYTRYCRREGPDDCPVCGRGRRSVGA